MIRALVFGRSHGFWSAAPHAVAGAVTVRAYALFTKDPVRLGETNRYSDNDADSR